MSPTIRISGTADLVAALPYHLGYHPTDSVVAAVVSGGRLGLVARLDLPPPEETGAATEVVVGPVLREDPDGVLLLGYELEEGASRLALDHLASQFDRRGVDVLLRVVVRDGRWYGLDCPDDCCPAEGTPLAGAYRSPAVADYVGLEVAPLTDQHALAARVAADPERSAAVAAALSSGRRRGPSRTSGGGADRAVAWPGEAFGMPDSAGRARTVRRMVWLTTWARVLDTRFATAEPALEPEALADLVRSLRDIQVRDGLIAWLCPGSLPLHDLDPDLVDLLSSCLPPALWASRRRDDAVVAGRRLLSRLHWLVQAVPDRHAAPALTVLAHVAWWLGDGATTRVALERALEHTPDYRLAVLLERMVDLAVRPSRAEAPGGGHWPARGATPPMPA